jgi:hypothetical protein
MNCPLVCRLPDLGKVQYQLCTVPGVFGYPKFVQYWVCTFPWYACYVNWYSTGPVLFLGVQIPWCADYLNLVQYQIRNLRCELPELGTVLGMYCPLVCMLRELVPGM